jgi:oligopeptidase B
MVPHADTTLGDVRIDPYFWLRDDRRQDAAVIHWEPAKWVARLRATRTDHNPLLLRTNMGAGHGGASGRYDALRENAIRYAFILDQLGIHQ